MRAAVVGAGIAGASCARVLSCVRGWRVDVFDQGRKVGGRASSRQWREEDGGLVFDHGVGVVKEPVYDAFAVGGQSGAALVEECVGRDVWRRWNPSVVKIVGTDGEVVVEKQGAEKWWLAVPRQSRIVEKLLEASPGLQVHSGVSVGRLERRGQEWVVRDKKEEELGVYDTVIVATHPAGATRLGLPEEVVKVASSMEAAPVWVVMAVLGTEQLDWDIAEIDCALGPDISRIIVESHKPARSKLPMRVVVHSTSLFAANNLETSPSAVANILQPQIEAVLKTPVTASVAHRWSKALTVSTSARDRDYYLDPLIRIGLVGDYFGPPPGTLVGAFLSGYHLAKALTGPENDRSLL